MAERGKLGTVINVLLVIAVLATLGISIGILITTINIKNNQNTSNNNNNGNTSPPPVTTQPAGTGTTQKPATQSTPSAPMTTGSTQNNGNIVNVKPPTQIHKGQTKYNSFLSVVQRLKVGLNTNVNPCDDFYKYTCSAYNQNTPMSFDISDSGNFLKMAQQMMNATYVAMSPNPVKTVTAYFNKCQSARANWNTLVANGDMVTQAINQLRQGEAGFESQTQLPFPMYDQNSSAPVTAFPTDIGMGFLLGQPIGASGVSSLVSAFTDTNWKDPHGKNGYSVYVDQPTTILPNTYYLKAWTSYQSVLIRSVVDTMKLYASTQNKVLDDTQLHQDAADLVQLDYMLATTFSTDDTTRRQFARSYNPMTVKQMMTQYPNINWHVYFPEALLASPDAQQTLLGNPSYNVLVMEPAKLQLLNDALVVNNKYNIKPSTVLNYIYYSVINNYADYLPWPPQNSLRSKMVEASAKKRKGRRGIVPEKRKYEKKQMTVSQAAISCAAETMEVLQYANARVFIDNIYPTSQSRVDLRNNVAKLASSILIGFRSMIDQLSWMSTSSKKGAYNKIENLVKNIGYPDWITDDNQLTQYHVPLGISTTDDYFTMVRKTTKFSLYNMWQSISKGAANRIDFNGPPGTTNAWYQPELNSITFPAAILRQPFYDPNWPAAFNFGGMGVIAGHELTHGFDDQGVQWDGTGVLNGWMDSPSLQSFTNMAGCVVNEYSGFCPLNKTQYGTAACVDGAQTQGENIADNGGIHSAFRAYKNYVNLNGPDPQLPDPALQEFTADQLFFLAFAQVWCQYPPSDASIERQMLVDVHSPSVYRVWGTIQNFPAFKSAFNCPVSSYAPEKHCNVWVSDIKPSYGQPVVKTDLNILPAPQITPQNLNAYNGYSEAVSFFKPAVDTTADPCNNFWQYSCGLYDKQVSFHFADQANLLVMAQQLTSPSYNATIQSSTALTKEKAFFDACVATTGNSTANNNTLVSKDYMKAKVSMLASLLGSNFTLVTGETATKPTPVQLAGALAYLSFKQGIDTYISPYVDTNWIDNTKGYRMFIDQNTAEYSKTYYSPNAFKNIMASYINSTTKVLLTYCAEQGITVDPVQLKANVTKLIQFEQTIAYGYSTDDTTRRQYQRSWNLMNAAGLATAYPFIDWPTYLAQVPAIAQPVVQAAGFQVSVMEIGMIGKFSADYTNGVFDPAMLVNYLYLRLILDNAQYLPTYKSSFEEMPKDEYAQLGLSRRGKGLPKAPRRRAAAVTQTQSDCVSMANNLMQFANGRVFIDYLYPTAQSRVDIRTSAGGVIKNVINSFQGMLEQLDWMDAATKRKALDKTDGLFKNIAFPDWIANNTALDQYYQDLQFASTDNYYDMWDKLIKFNLELQYQQLTFTSTDRHDFLGQPGTVNAWYQPELNSITFPAGILRPPYFHPQYPASVNYGGLGVVAGHELTHGFDDEGVQWGPTGNLAGWMDNSTTTGFKNMASCVINEYSQFCPLDASKYSPNCVNGQQTQGENIADNGGIHSAFRAYRTHIALNGPDPQLPDRIFGQFTHDQLFFLNFGQVWCEKRRSDDALYRQLMVDPHSPSMYRVFGTIQNFPAFQTAFNCPANSKYTPQNHCKVWVPNVEA